MPVYRTPPQYVEEAVGSILKQAYSNLEFIIIEDPSEMYL